MQALSLPRYVRDLSPLAGLESLRIIDLIYSEHIDSLLPLQNLPNLQEILIRQELYDSLSEQDRQIFTPANNRYYERIHVHFSDIPHFSGGIQPTIIRAEWTLDDQRVIIENETIESFAFLQHYPRMRDLHIRNSEILSFDYLADYASNLESIRFEHNTIADGLKIPYIENLVNLYITGDENFPQLIQLTQLNSHLPGRLDFRFGNVHAPIPRNVSIPVMDFEGLENFTSLQELSLFIRCHRLDFSALSGMRNLHTLVLYANEVESLSPLSELTRLRQIVDLDRGLSIPREVTQVFGRPWYITRFVR